MAIKCIEHDGDTSAAVENEVQLMLSLDHANIVKAFHYITYRHTLNPNGSSSSQSGARDSGGGGGNGSRSSNNQQVQQAGVASRGSSGRQQQQQQEKQQQRQLENLQQQLQDELGPKQQWLLNMHLGFLNPKTGNNMNSSQQVMEGAAAQQRDDAHSVISSSEGGGAGALAACSSSSQADTLSVALSGPGTVSCGRTASAVLSSDNLMVVDAAGSSSRDSSMVTQGVSSLPSSPAASPAAAVAAPRSPAESPADQLRRLRQQQQPNSQGSLLLPVGGLRAATQQQEQQPSDQNDGDGVLSPDHPPCPRSSSSSQHSGSRGGGLLGSRNSASDYPSSGQPLTPNQKVQLQRYLLKQQHLLQSSGMRVRSSGALPPLSATGGGAGGGGAGGGGRGPGGAGGGVPGSSGNSNGAGGGGGGGAVASYMSDSSVDSDQMGRRAKVLQRSRTYIVQGEWARSTICLVVVSSGGRNARARSFGALLMAGRVCAHRSLWVIQSYIHTLCCHTSLTSHSFSRSNFMFKLHAHSFSLTPQHTEYCDLGTLTNYASKVLTDPSDEHQMVQLLVLLQDAARGIAALHSKSVVHGDGGCRLSWLVLCAVGLCAALCCVAGLLVRLHACWTHVRGVGVLRLPLVLMVCAGMAFRACRCPAAGLQRLVLAHVFVRKTCFPPS